MNRPIRRVVIAALLAFPAPALTQISAAPDTADPGGRSPLVAWGLSTIGAVVPAGMMVRAVYAQDEEALVEGFTTGLLLLIPGPSTGFFYGRRPWRGLASMGVRTAGLAGMTASMAICWDVCSGSGRLWAMLTGWGGLGLMVAATVYDVVRVGSDVRRANSRRAARATPTVDFEAGGMQLGLAVRF